MWRIVRVQIHLCLAFVPYSFHRCGVQVSLLSHPSSTALPRHILWLATLHYNDLVPLCIFAVSISTPRLLRSILNGWELTFGDVIR